MAHLQRLQSSIEYIVEPAWPTCLADTTLTHKFMALWATQLALAARDFSRTLGREVTADDIEPVNWALIERAQQVSAVDYAAAQAAEWGLPACAAAVVGGRLGSATQPDGGRTAAATNGIREQSRASDRTDAPR